MSRTLSDPALGLIQDQILPIKFGGTSGSTAKNARTNLGMIGTDMLNQPGGVAQLDGSGLIPLPLLLDYAENVVTIDGELTVQGSTENQYTITNYDYQGFYTLRVVGNGSVSRDKDTITYTAPSSATPSGDGFIINGKKYLFTVSQNGVVKPTIVAPVADSINVATTYTFESSSFQFYGGSQTHQSSDWEIATDSNFASVVFSVTNNITHKTSWPVVGLTADTEYYVRLRHKGTVTGYSPWSETIHFTTKALYTSMDIGTLVSNETDTGAEHGYSVAITQDGTTVLIGAPGIDGVGAAFVFTKVNDVWTQSAKLSPTDNPEYTHTKTGFGSAVAINTVGNTILVGSPTDGNNSQVESGSVYVYTKTGDVWSRQTIIHGDSWAGATAEQFGCSLSISSTGDLVVIGARTGNSGKGYVYTYTRTDAVWSQQQKLQPTVLTNVGEFGYSVSLSANGIYIGVGARNTAAYVFKYSSSTWSQQAKLDYDTTSDNFGVSVAIDSAGTTLLVGADYATNTQSLQGTVYVFTRSVNTWSKQTKLVSSNPTVNEHFGFSVSINSAGDTALIGAPYYGSSINTFEKGCTYTFTRSSNVWNQKKQLVPLNSSSYGVGAFVKQNQKPATGYWRSLTTFGTTVYAGTSNGRLYKQTNGTGDFVLMAQQFGKAITGMCATATDVYLCLGAGDIYKQTNGTGDFVALNQTSRNWRGLAAVGNDIYACVNSGNIYKQTGGLGDFESIGDANRAWSAMCAEGTTLYAVVSGGSIYRKLPTESTFSVYYLSSALWTAITASEGDVYAIAQSANLYLKKSNSGTFINTGQWPSTNPQPYSIVALGCNLYVGADTANGMYKLVGGASRYGYSVAMSPISSYAIVGMPLKNTNSGIGIGETRLLQ